MLKRDVLHRVLDMAMGRNLEPGTDSCDFDIFWVFKPYQNIKILLYIHLTHPTPLEFSLAHWAFAIDAASFLRARSLLNMYIISAEDARHPGDAKVNGLMIHNDLTSFKYV